MRRWLFLVATSLSFAAMGCGGDNGNNAVDGSTVDSRVTDGGGSDARTDGGANPIDAPPGTPDARFDAGPPGIDAAPAIDAPPAIDAAPAIDAPHVCVTNACGANTTGTICGVGGGVVTCTADSFGCPVASGEVACTGGLVCSGAAPGAGCNCPTIDTGNAGSACSSVGTTVCEASGADGLNNVIICTSVAIGDQVCLQWQVVGGASNEDAEGNCHAAGVTCDVTTHTCVCPANNSSVFFANPVEDRTLVTSRNIATTGVQFPPVCAYPTIHAALAKANQLIAGTSNRATVVMAGGTPLAPALFSAEGTAWPLTIPDRILLTVDTDTRVLGILPSGPFDPRLEVLLVTPIDGTSGVVGVSLGAGTSGGGQAYGFTIAGGPCVGGAGATDCSAHDGTALFVTGAGGDGTVVNGPRARVSSIMLEGGSGNIVGTGADLGALTLAAGSGGSVTGSITTDADLDNLHAVTIFPDLTVPASIAFAGVYTLTSGPVNTAGTWTFTFYTNKTVSVPAAVTNYSASSAGTFRAGLVLSGTAGTIESVVAENFNFTSSDVGVRVLSDLSTAGYPFNGVYAYNNVTGVLVSNGLVTVNDVALPLGLPGFPVVPHPTIEHSLGAGLVVAGDVGKLAAPSTLPRVVATNLSVINTTGDVSPANFGGQGVGITVGGFGSVALTGGGAAGNANDGALVEGPSPAAATPTFLASGSTFTANLNGVEVLEGNTTFVGSHLDGNTSSDGGVGLVVRSAESDTTVSVSGGTINSNLLGINAFSTSANVVVDSASGLAAVSNNATWGLLADGGTFSITHASFRGNGGGFPGDTCDEEGDEVHHSAIAIGFSATSAISTSEVSANFGGGIVYDESFGNTISNTAVNGNGLAVNVCDDDFSGIVVTEGGDLNFVGLLSTVDSNAFNGIEIDSGVVNSTAGGGFTAVNNVNAGIQVVSGSGNFTVGGDVTGDCGAGHAATCAGIENHGAVTATGLTISANGTEGVRNYGSFDGTSLTIDSNGTDGFWNNSTDLAAVTQSEITANVGNGVHVIASATPGSPFASDDPVDTWGLNLDHDTISGNAVAGVALGGAGQAGDVTTIVQNSQIGLNGGAGVSATGTATAGTETGVTLISNQIEQNLGSGLAITSAFIKDATLFSNQFFPGMSQNVVSHNGFAASDTTCTAGETAAQIVVAGSDPTPGTAFDCTALATNDACVAQAANRCMWVSDNTGCRRAYQLNGNIGNCNQANTIAGYEGHFTATTGATVVGVLATAGPLGPAFVNVSDNIWPTSGPALNSDYFVDSGAAIGPGSNFARCTPSVLSGGCPIFNP